MLNACKDLWDLNSSCSAEIQTIYYLFYAGQCQIYFMNFVSCCDVWKLLFGRMLF